MLCSLCLTLTHRHRETRRHMHAHTRMHTRVHAHTPIHTHACTHTRMDTQAHVCTHRHTYTQAHITEPPSSVKKNGCDMLGPTSKPTQVNYTVTSTHAESIFSIIYWAHTNLCFPSTTYKRQMSNASAAIYNHMH